MSRSGYSDDCDDHWQSIMWSGAVKSAIRGKRGQAFLRELADAMDAMPDKSLIEDELINKEGHCCTIGVVCKARGISVEGVDVYDAGAVGKLVGIARSMAAEIEYYNDEWGSHNQTPQERWKRMRKWVDEHIKVAS